MKAVAGKPANNKRRVVETLMKELFMQQSISGRMAAVAIIMVFSQQARFQLAWLGKE